MQSSAETIKMNADSVHYNIRLLNTVEDHAHARLQALMFSSHKADVVRGAIVSDVGADI